MTNPAPTTILITLDPNTVPLAQLERVRACVPEAQVYITNRREEMQELAGKVEVLAGWMPPDLLARAEHLHWYQQWGAGADWLMRHPELARRNFVLTNASGVHSIPISEHILAFLLAFARRLPWAIRSQEKHAWVNGDGERPPAFELAGKTMLLVGIGAIGRRTAKIAHALGMRVLGVRRQTARNAESGIEEIYGPEQLDALLPQADFVVLTIPLTNETRGMFNSAAFQKMKPSSYFINIGRGATVDELALIEALRHGQIAGAGLDVFAQEPLPAESPLWEMENVIITPHYSGDTPQYDERALEIFIDNLERYVKGQPLRNVVDPQRGY